MNDFPKPVFEPTFNLGHVLTMCGFLVAGGGAYYGTRVQLDYLNDRVGKLELAINQLAAVTVTAARQDEKINGIERRVDKLEALHPKIP